MKTLNLPVPPLTPGWEWKSKLATWSSLAPLGDGGTHYQQLGMNVSSPYLAFSAATPAGWAGASLHPGGGGNLCTLWILLTVVGLGPPCVPVWWSLQ